jgi:hypothetical protein
MMVSILRQTREDIEHSSPAYRDVRHGTSMKYFPGDYDAVVMMVRNGAWNAKSLLNRDRAHSSFDSPEAQILTDIADIACAFVDSDTPVFIVTYESMVYETEHCLYELCQQLGVDYPAHFEPVLNGNEKFWGKGWAGDDRELHHR